MLYIKLHRPILTKQDNLVSRQIDQSHQIERLKNTIPRGTNVEYHKSYSKLNL